MDGGRRASLRTRTVLWWTACSLAFGVLSALRSDVDSVFGFVVIALAVSAAWGVPTTILMLLVVTRLDRRTRHREGLPAKKLWEPVEVRQTLVVDAPRAVAFARAMDAIRRIPRTSIKHADGAAGVIEGRIGVTWRSWGERLTVRVQGHAEDQSEIEIVSEPRLTTTIVDYGKNQRNVDEFLRAMNWSTRESGDASDGQYQ